MRFVQLDLALLTAICASWVKALTALVSVL